MTLLTENERNQTNREEEKSHCQEKNSFFNHTCVFAGLTKPFLLRIDGAQQQIESSLNFYDSTK